MLWQSFIRKLGWLQSRYAGFGEERNLFPVPGSEGILGRPSVSLITRISGYNVSSRSVFLKQSLPVPSENAYTVIVYPNPLNPELNPICYLLALLAHHFLHVSRIRVKSLTIRLLVSYIYMEHLFLMFLDHTQRRSTVGRTPLDE